MSTWAKVKDATNRAAAATKRAAQKAKLSGDISNCQWRITNLKQEMGMDIYQMMDSDDLQNVQSRFQECKALVKEQEEQITKLQGEIARIEAEARAADHK